MQIGSEKWKKLITDGAKDLEIHIGQAKTDLFAIHALELIKWTRKINLTAVTDPLEVASKHFLDSIMPAPIISPYASLLDIGSGGGFPGIPLKVLIPSLSVTLIDASRKKVSFLKHVIRRLSLDNIDARHVRAEDLAKDRIFTNTYDVIVSRALSSMETFVLMALPLLAKDGTIIAMKGRASAEEIESEHLLINKSLNITKDDKNNFTLALKKYTLPYLKLERSIIIFKSALTPGFA
jgi:16S rRNA (guanine527-N7)-methyltransferase